MKNSDALLELSHEKARRGKTVLRLCTINPRTTEEDVAKTVEALDEHARKESGCGLISEWGVYQAK